MKKKPVWDVNVHHKVQSICTVFNEEMKNLNKGVEAFTKEAAEKGYEVRVNKKGELIAEWKPNKLILKKQPPKESGAEN